MRALFLVVPKAKGEAVRKNLLGMDALNKELRIESDDGNLLIPLTREVDLGFEVMEGEARPARKKARPYAELVDIPEELRGFLPRSFDLVGDVVILKLADELRPFAEEIGRAIANANRCVRTVAVDEGVKGDFRVRKIRVVYGDESLETVHRAYGVGFEVDLSKCYFSPRIATETWRITRQVEPNEVVVDMFCGVGPFALTIAKHAKPAIVYAIDSNPHAIRYLERNIARNRIENVRPILGDAGEVMKGITDASRVIIDLPHSSLEYFGPAVRSVEEGIVHYYEILEEASVDERIDDLKAIASEAGKSIRLAGTRKVRSFSPSEAHFVLDLLVSG